MTYEPLNFNLFRSHGNLLYFQALISIATANYPVTKHHSCLCSQKFREAPNEKDKNEKTKKSRSC